MVHKIERDLNRFKQIVRGKIRENLRKYVSQGEMIGKQGKEFVSIPIPQLDTPRFRYGDKGNGGVSSGEGESGTPVSPGQDQPGKGNAGSDSGKHLREVEISLAELTEILGDELQLPRIEPKGEKNIKEEHDRYNSVRTTGPNSLRHFKRTYRQALRRQVITGDYSPADPKVIPIHHDERFRAAKTIEEPEAQAVIIYMMDVSGSMGDEQKEIVRCEAFWIDTWLKSQYKGTARRFIIHDAEAKEVDEDTFYRTKESGGTVISSAYQLCADLIEKDFPTGEWNIYALHFSDGDNWGEDDARCGKLLKERIIPAVNLFGYVQVASPYGSGRFKDTLEQSFASEEKVVISEVAERSAILDSIKEVLGTGR